MAARSTADAATGAGDHPSEIVVRAIKFNEVLRKRYEAADKIVDHSVMTRTIPREIDNRCDFTNIIIAPHKEGPVVTEERDDASIVSRRSDLDALDRLDFRVSPPRQPPANDAHRFEECDDNDDVPGPVTPFRSQTGRPPACYAEESDGESNLMSFEDDGDDCDDDDEPDIRRVLTGYHNDEAPAPSMGSLLLKRRKNMPSTNVVFGCAVCRVRLDKTLIHLHPEVGRLHAAHAELSSRYNLRQIAHVCSKYWSEVVKPNNKDAPTLRTGAFLNHFGNCIKDPSIIFNRELQKWTAISNDLVDRMYVQNSAFEDQIMVDSVAMDMALKASAYTIRIVQAHEHHLQSRRRRRG